MTKAEFNESFNILFAAYIYSQEKVNPATQEAYWVVLCDVPSDIFQQGVKQCLVECKFFPSINEIVTKMFPPFTVLPQYNPYGDGQLITVSSMEQLGQCQKKALEDNEMAKQLVDGMLKKIE